MASRRKQRMLVLPDEERNAEEAGALKEEEEEEDDGEKNEDAESSDESDSDSEIGLEVMVDFEAHAPQDVDVPGMKQLLRQLFLKAPVDLSELADLIVQQNYIGSVLKQALVSGDSEEEEEDDDDGGAVFGLTTLISLANRKSSGCLEQLCSFLVSRCEAHNPPGLAARLKAVLTDASRPVGLLLSERFLNVPPQAALPLYKQLLSELADAKKFGRHCGSCYYLLLICKTCRVTRAESNKNVHKAKTETSYLNVEEETFEKLVEMKYSYPVHGEGDSYLGGRWSFDDPTMEPWRDVLLVPITKLASAVAGMAEMLAG